MASVRVVVVGGGPGGLTVAQRLEKVANVCVTLVDRKDHFQNMIGSPKAFLQPQRTESTTKLYTELLQSQSCFIHGSATSVTTTEVTVEVSGGGIETVPFDYLVLSTGSTYQDGTGFFKSDSTTLAEYKKLQAKVRGDVKAAKTVVVVGGGPTGVETAVLVKAAHPAIDVHLVQGNGPRWVSNFWSEKDSARVTKQLEKVGVVTHVGTRAEDNGDGTMKLTQTGEVIKADYVLKTTGIQLNTEWLRNSGLSDILDSKGQIEVRPTLQVKGHDHIYAVGDAVSLDVPKMWANAWWQSKTAANNIKSAISKKNPKDIKYGKVMPARYPMSVRTGVAHAVVKFPFTTVAGTIPGKLKNFQENLMPKRGKSL